MVVYIVDLRRLSSVSDKCDQLSRYIINNIIVNNLIHIKY